MVVPLIGQFPSDPVQRHAYALESLLCVPTLAARGGERAAPLLRVLQVRHVEGLRVLQPEVLPTRLQEGAYVVQVRYGGVQLVHPLDGAGAYLSHEPTDGRQSAGYGGGRGRGRGHSLAEDSSVL